MAGKTLTEAQASLLIWIARRDEGGKGARYLPQSPGTPRIMVNLMVKGMVQIGKSKSGKLAWRATPEGRAALKED